MKRFVLWFLAMGNCSSIHKSKRPLVPSPRKEKNANGNGREKSVKVVTNGFSSKTSEFDNKRETFFDSRAWLDSDCEDDYFSVDGDFTPSGSSTPNNQSSSLSTAYNRSFSSEPLPTGRKKLADLFKEASRPNASHEKVETDQSLNRANSTSRDLKKKHKADDKAAQCCLPNLSYSFSERSQRMGAVDCIAC